ncbi:MAG: hypothetical protein OEW75_07765, partial [Cyclobacteriaceae bacterium]|nr:hypothetical protein [Cyclobacteriaceae bacterium]
DKISLETFVGKPVLPSNSGETVIGEHLFTGMSVGWQTQKSLWKITGLTGMDSTLASFNRSPIPTSKYFEKNTAASFYGRRNLSNKISLEVEYAFSNLITRNHTNQQVKNLYHAFKSGLSWQSKSGSWNVRYDRTDPGYRTHLLTYINNDLENILLGHTINFFSGKINVRTEIGRQRNNLNKQEASEQKNMAYKGSFNAKINKTSTITGHYNTFKSTVISWINNDTLNYQDPNRLDSMVLVSINQQAMLQYSWQILSKNKKRKVLNTSFQIQQADMGQGIQQVINSTTSLVFQNPQKEQNWGIQTTFGKRGFGESNQNTGTYSIYTHRKLFKNWNFSGNMALQLFSQKGHTQFINNNRINISRVIQKKYALSGSISRTSRFEETGNINSWRLQLQCSIKL